MDQDDKQDAPQTIDEPANKDQIPKGLSGLQMVAIGVIIFAVGMFIYGRVASRPAAQDKGPQQLAELPDAPLEPYAIDSTGPHTWEIDGRKFPVRRTYWMERGEELIYVMEYNPRVYIPNAQADKVLKTIFPLMKHAYQTGLYKRPDPDAKQPDTIGVTLIDATRAELKVYRIPLKIKDIARYMDMLKQAETRPALLDDNPPRFADLLSPAAKEFFPILMQLSKNQTLNTPQGVELAGAHLPAMLALTDDDMRDVQDQRFFPFLILISRLVKDVKHQDYVLQHFDEIAHWRVKLTWAATLFAAKRRPPAVLEYMKSSAQVPARQALLQRLFGEKYDAVMNSILNSTTAPAASTAQEAAARPAIQPAK